MKGKQISKAGMIIGALVIVGYNIGYLIIQKSIPTMDEQKSVVFLGASLVAIFSPLYISVFLDKIFKR